MLQALNNIAQWQRRFLRWRVRHIRYNRFVLIMAGVVGFGSGLVAVLIKSLSRLIREWVNGQINDHGLQLLFFLSPLLGIGLVVLFVKYIVRDKMRQGIPSALYAISKRNGILKKRFSWAAIITSSLTVGFGGSVGLEGPTISSSASLGSNLARWTNLNYKTRILMIGCAATGTMAAIFKAPIAAVIFAIEVFMLDLTFASMVPLLIASVAAVLTSTWFHGDERIIPFTLRAKEDIFNYPWYAVLGVLAAIVSIYFSKFYFLIEGIFERMKSKGLRWIIGGSILGVLIFLFPSLYGEGFGLINQLMEGNVNVIFENTIYSDLEGRFLITLAILLALVFFKLVATVSTFGAGGVGGIFSPTLFMGSVLGFGFAFAYNHFMGNSLESANFAMVGMASLLAGVLHAPLMAIFLVAELTGGYELFVPLMIACTISFAISKSVFGHSVYTLQLAKRGELITHHKDKAVLNRLNIRRLLENNFITVHPTMPLGDLVKVVSESQRNIFPVVDSKGKLEAIITLDDIRSIMFDHKMYDKVKVKDLMHAPTAVSEINEPMSEVMEKFKKTGAWNMAITEKGYYRGFVSKSKLFSVYRRMLMEFSED
jgi:CIC family chloride channel protein